MRACHEKRAPEGALLDRPRLAPRGDQTARILVADGPLGPLTISNSTFCCSFNDLKPDIWISEWWAKRSLPPSSGVMKPKPFASLNHLTVPVAITISFESVLRANPPGCGVTTLKGGN